MGVRECWRSNERENLNSHYLSSTPVLVRPVSMNRDTIRSRVSALELFLLGLVLTLEAHRFFWL